MMVEILDHWQDAGLTLGERSDLLVLAENANDGTRETWPKGGVHQEYIRRRAGKTAGSWKNAIAKLIKKGVLSYAVHGGHEMTGFPGQVAVYHIVPLCPEAPHDGLMGQCTRTERGTPTVTLSGGGDQGKGHLPEEKGHLSSEMGHLSEDEWSTPTVTPTPPYPSSKSPSTTTSSSPAEPVEEAAVTAPPATDGGGGGSISSRSTAEEITAALDYRGRPPDKRQRQTITDRLTAALDDGWTLDALAVHLDLGTAPVNYAAGVYMHRLQPESLANAKATLLSARPSGGARGAMPTAEDYENATLESVLGGGKPTGGAWEQATERARQGSGYRPFECPPGSAYTDRGFGDGTDSRVAGWMDLSRKLPGHKPYTNDAWSEPADPVEAAKIPHCGDWACDSTTRLRDPGDGTKPTICPDCHPAGRWPVAR